MKFKFNAIKQNGEKYDGEREAKDKFAFYDLIRKEGGIIIHVEAIKSKWEKSLTLPSIFNRVKTTDKIQFVKNLGVMIEAGLPLSRALNVMERQSKNKTFKGILSGLGLNIGQGQSLSSSIDKYPKVFSKLFISMVRAGEESGSLTSSLKMIGDQLEKSNQLTKKIRGAMIYPAIIFLVMIAVAILLLIFVIPTLTDVFREMNVELPLTTQFVIFISDMLKNNTLVVLGFFLALFPVIFYSFRTVFGRRMFHAALLKIPLISNMTKEINSARTARTLSSLLSAGVDFLVAIKITEDVVQNIFYKNVMKKAVEQVEKGKPISEIFADEQNLYPPFVSEMVSIGEETGKLGDMFENVAVYYENEVEQKTKDLSTIIEPFLMVFIGTAVGFFAISMLSPIYSLVNAI